MARRNAVMRALLVAFCLLFNGKWAGAQTDTPPTRADALRAERAAKAQALAPHHPNALESGLNFFEDRAVFILDREGFYPKLGSITVGSGFAYGLGFRDRDLLNNYGAVDIWVAGSTRGYFAAEGRLRFPELAHKRLLVEGWAGRRDYAGEVLLRPGDRFAARRPVRLRPAHDGVRRQRRRPAVLEADRRRQRRVPSPERRPRATTTPCPTSRMPSARPKRRA